MTDMENGFAETDYEPTEPASGHPDGVEVIYDGADILVRAALSPVSRTVVVTFSPRREHGERGGPRRVGFGETFLRDENIPVICFISKANHWWLTPEMDEAIEQIRDRLAGYDRVVTYGVSMGAYGALAFSRALGATDVVAFSPQASIVGDLPLDPSWVKDLVNVPKIHGPIEYRLASDARVLIVSDPFSSMDRQHRRVVENAHRSESLLVPFSGHRSAMLLHEQGLLKPLVLDVVRGTLDIGEARRINRQARRNSARYWKGIATTMEKRGRRDLSMWAKERAAELCLTGIVWPDEFRYLLIKRYVLDLVNDKRPDEAMEFAQRIAEVSGGEVYGLLMQSRLYLLRHKAKDAVRTAKAASEQAPTSAPPQLALARALVSAGRTGAASKHMGQAQKFGGGDFREWLELARDFEAAGAVDLAHKAASRAQSRSKRGESAPVTAALERYASAAKP